MPPTAPPFPRQTGVGLCSMSARVAGIMAPLIHLLDQYHRAIPMAIFGSAPVVGGLLCVLLPETRGTDLVDDTGAASPELRWVSGALNLRHKKIQRCKFKAKRNMSETRMETVLPLPLSFLSSAAGNWKFCAREKPERME